MARTVEEIKAELTANFIANPTIQSLYELDSRKSFADQFSKVSLESIFFHVIAVSIWVLEKLFDGHKNDVDDTIANLKPHRLLWYVNKVKAYLHSFKLPTEDGHVISDTYSLSGVAPSKIEAAKIVKYAVATESNGSIYMKVAKADNKGNPTQLSQSEYEGLRYYLSQIKDAGVDIRILNEPADDMNVELTLYYDPTLYRASKDDKGIDTLTSLIDGEDHVRATVIEVISNLPFNGEYRNADLMRAVEALEGIIVVDIDSVETCANGSNNFEKVVGYSRPYSGYYALKDLVLHCYPYQITDEI